MKNDLCPVVNSEKLKNALTRLDFAWPFDMPKAGQFFMLKPEAGPVFLPRPLVQARGAGSAALCALKKGEAAFLTGPLGNSFFDFLPPNTEKIALLAGGTGLAPLVFFAETLKRQNSGASACLKSGRPGFPLQFASQIPLQSLAREIQIDFFAGFKTENAVPAAFLQEIAALSDNFFCILEEEPFLPPSFDKIILKKGLITDFFKPSSYDAVFVCGPEGLLSAAAALCKKDKIRCIVSLERRMACGVGACLGCAVRTVDGMRRCCADRR